MGKYYSKLNGPPTERQLKRRESKRIKFAGNYYSLFERTAYGETILICSFHRWIYANVYKFSGYCNYVDYFGARQLYYKEGGLVKPDVICGRNFKLSRDTDSRINIIDGSVQCPIDIPACFTSGEMSPQVQTPQQLTIWSINAPASMRIIGYRGHLIVVQFLHEHLHFIPEFYIINIWTRKCELKFSSQDIHYGYYDAYISPDCKLVYLHFAQVHYNGQPNGYRAELTNDFTHSDGELKLVFAHSIPRTSVICFDNRYMCDYMFIAKDKSITSCNITNPELSSGEKDIPSSLSGQIRQIKSSHCGEYLVIRTLDPVQGFRFTTNVVTVLKSSNFQVLLNVDTPLSKYPWMDILHMVVFPHFSICDTSLAVMRVRSARAEVVLYKLPPTMKSLKNLVRSKIRQYVPQNDKINNLPLPSLLIKFLNYRCL